jgi:pantothenate kinase type III
MSNLVFIDAGNTHVSIARNKVNNNWEVKKFKNSKELHFLDQIEQDDLVVISSVNGGEKLKTELTKKKIASVSISDFKKDQSFNNWQHAYTKTIGDDRIIQSYYLAKKYPNAKLTLIDAGSFITSDYILSGDYRGGTISPGIELFLEDYKRGIELPEITLMNFQKYLQGKKDPYPKNTVDAIFQGVYEYLRSLVLKVKKMGMDTLVLSGGNASVMYQLVKYLDLDINIILAPNLIFDSLEYFFLTKDDEELYLQ